jgi:hypothetical protein
MDAGEIAARACRYAQREVAAGRGVVAEGELRWAEERLAAMSARARGPALQAAQRALAEVRTVRAQLRRTASRAPTTDPTDPTQPVRQVDVAGQLRLAEQLLALGQLKRAGVVVEAIAATLADLGFPKHHPWPLQLARLQKQLAPAPRVRSKGRGGGSGSSSVRAVSGGLPTLGRRR